MDEFTPVSALIGGALIGLAAALFALVNGRIAGISGILGGIVGGRTGAPSGDVAWRAAFVAGLVAGPLLVALATGALPDVSLQASTPLLIVAGLLVGFGTRLGGGCTSGHGVCGIARGSPRSLWATVVFFATAVAAVFVLRHVVGG